VGVQSSAAAAAKPALPPHAPASQSQGPSAVLGKFHSLLAKAHALTHVEGFNLKQTGVLYTAVCSARAVAGQMSE